jgi:hypothetical protein
MSHSLVQVQAIATINAKMVPAKDLPSDYTTNAIKWLTIDKKILLSTIFGSYWIIQKTMGSSSNYNMYCGDDVRWRNTDYNIPDKLPDLILVIENSEFKGILIGDVISELIKMGIYGIFTWLSPIVGATPGPVAPLVQEKTLDQILALAQTLHERSQVQGTSPRPMAYIQAGNTLIPVPAGGTLQVFPTMMNISHFRRS